MELLDVRQRSESRLGEESTEILKKEEENFLLFCRLVLCIIGWPAYGCSNFFLEPCGEVPMKVA